MNIILLYTLGPILILIYKVLEYLNVWNKITGRNKALSGIERLKSVSGFPQSFIYDEEPDKKEFEALYKRIKKNSKNEKIRSLIKEGNRPSLLTPAGSPIMFRGVPLEWEQKNKGFYSSNHSVLMIFGVTRNGSDKGNAERCCTLGELEKWIDLEKKAWEFWLGVVVMSIFSIASIIWRLEVTEKL